MERCKSQVKNFERKALAHAATFVEDVSALNGVLFGGDLKGEALFYDGDKVTNLFDYFCFW